MIRKRHTLVVILASVLANFFEPAAASMEKLTTVSPGSPQQAVTIAEPCPTFSWGSIPDVSHYSLAVHRLMPDGNAEEQAALIAEVPGNALSWTPALYQCLEPGRYVWYLAARNEKDGNRLSEARYFSVSDQPSPQAVQQALEVLESYLARQVAADISTSSESRVDPTTLQEDTPEIAPSTVATGSILDNGNPVFTTANDGTGSGLDADLLDGQQLADIEASVLPSGAVMFFDLTQCPTGWTEIATAQGRSIVGRPTGGTLGGTVGTALTNLENRIHSHVINPPSTSSTSAGGHNHTVDPPNTGSSVTGSHLHSINPPSTSSNVDTHNHKWSQYNSGGWVLYNSGGSGELITNWDNGIGNEGSGWDPLAVTTNHASADYYTLSDSHAHSVDIGSFSSTSGGSHNHTVNIAAVLTDTQGGHVHSTDITSFGAESTSGSLPYIQYLVCRKN